MKFCLSRESFRLKGGTLHLKSLIAVIGFPSPSLFCFFSSLFYLLCCPFAATQREEFLPVTVNEMMALFSSHDLMV